MQNCNQPFSVFFLKVFVFQHSIGFVNKREIYHLQALQVGHPWQGLQGGGRGGLRAGQDEGERLPLLPPLLLLPQHGGQVGRGGQAATRLSISFLSKLAEKININSLDWTFEFRNWGREMVYSLFTRRVVVV